MKLIIGLTGGIATGKSRVLREFRNLGARTIDCDVLARAAVQKGRPALKKISKVFGRTMLNPDGSLNRDRLGKTVFKNRAKKRLLENIIHPEVKKSVLSAVRKIPKGVVVVDVPLLFEAGWKGLFDETVLVWSPQKTQIERIVKRNHFTEKEALNRMKSQWPMAKKKQLADHVLNNSGDFSHTLSQARTLWKMWSPTEAPRRT